MITNHSAERIHRRHRKEIGHILHMVKERMEITPDSLIDQFRQAGEHCSRTRAVEGLKAAVILGLLTAETTEG